MQDMQGNEIISDKTGHIVLCDLRREWEEGAGCSDQQKIVDISCEVVHCYDDVQIIDKFECICEKLNV